MTSSVWPQRCALKWPSRFERHGGSRLVKVEFWVMIDAWHATLVRGLSCSDALDDRDRLHEKRTLRSSFNEKTYLRFSGTPIIFDETAHRPPRPFPSVPYAPRR